MFDPQTLSSALLAAVPEDGRSISNQSLQEALKGQFGELTKAQFMAARDALIEGGQTLSTLRDTLLPRLISGQLRLPEAKATLQEAGI